MYEELIDTVQTATRMGDNIIDATPYFLEANEKQAKGERRIGLGVMGLADMMIKLGVRYGSDESIALINDVFSLIKTEAYYTSAALAAEKGPFGFYNDTFVSNGFASGLPRNLRDFIRAKGIRNSHLLTIAPTGSTGTMVGVSTGLEPYFAFEYYRSGRLGENILVEAPIVQEFRDANNYEDDQLPDYFVSAMEIEPMDHVNVQCAIQQHVDSSISKTVNAPSSYAVEDVEQIYEALYAGGAKGGTVYVDGSRNAQVLSLKRSDNEQEKSEKPKVFVSETIKPLEQTSVKYGSEVGSTCPVCREGEVIDSGGCNTCNQCGAQLQCGM